MYVKKKREVNGVEERGRRRTIVGPMQDKHSKGILKLARLKGFEAGVLTCD